MTVNDRFIKFLDEKKISQTEIAEVFGVSRQSISGMKGGKSILTTKQIVTIAERYKTLNLRWLLTGEGKMETGYPENMKIDYVEDYRRCNKCDEKERIIKQMEITQNTLLKNISLLENLLGSGKKTGSD